MKKNQLTLYLIAIWELDSMCMQFEREDVIQIYLHRKRDYGLLSSAEQEVHTITKNNN